MNGSLNCPRAHAFVEETPQKATSNPPSDVQNNRDGKSAKTPDDPISKLELRLFDFTYQQDSEDARLKRLENFVFGSAQTGSDSERLAKLEKSVIEGKTPAAPIASVQAGSQANSAPQANANTSPPEADNPPPFNYTDYPKS